MAAKIIENLSHLAAGNASKLATNEVAQLLWSTYKHSTIDSLRVTAVTALAHLTRLQPSVFHNVVDKVGLPAMLGNLHLGLLRVQASLLTSLAVCLVALPGASTSKKIMQDREFLTAVMRILESPSAVNRAKAFIIIQVRSLVPFLQTANVFCCLLAGGLDIRFPGHFGKKDFLNSAFLPLSAGRPGCLHRVPVALLSAPAGHVHGARSPKTAWFLSWYGV